MDDDEVCACETLAELLAQAHARLDELQAELDQARADRDTARALRP
jgi:hypothetical protein